MKKVLSMLVAFGVCAMPLSAHAECGVKSALKKIIKDRVVPSITENASDKNGCVNSALSLESILKEFVENNPELGVIIQGGECIEGCDKAPENEDNAGEPENNPAGNDENGENEEKNDDECADGECGTVIVTPNDESIYDIIDKINGYIKDNYPEVPEISEDDITSVPEKPVETPTTPDVSPEENQKPSSMSEYAYEVVRLVNVERQKEGLSALTCNNTALNAAAQKRAEETMKSFSHTRPSGESCFTVLGEYGVSYRSAGENIAMGQRTPAEVVNSWMNSPGHRANILNAGFTQIGVGVYENGGRYYWSQMFIS